MFRKTSYTWIGLFAFPLLAAGQADSSPSSDTPSNTTLIPAATRLATAPKHDIRQLVSPQSVGAPSESTNPSATAVADAATAPAPAATLSAFARSIPNGKSSTLMWSSANATSCSGTGFSASGASGSLSVSPIATTTYSITCPGNGGSATQSMTVAVTPAPKLAVGMTLQATGSVAMHRSLSTGAPLVGVAVAPGSKGTIIGGPASVDGYTWWEVSYKGGLARWAVQDDLMQARQAAPTVTHSASPTSVPYTQSTTLAWTSTNATACSGTGTGFSPSGPSGSVAVSPYVTTIYSIACTGAGGSANQSATVTVTEAPQLAIGMTVTATDTINAWSTPSASQSAIGSEAYGSQGEVIGGPASADSSTWWKVSFNDDLTGWTHQSALAPASPNAPILTFRAKPASIAPGASSTLSWSSTNATACSGTGFSPTGVSGSVLLSPTVSATYSITCTGSGGSTTRTAAVIVNPFPRISWTQSLPVTFNVLGIVPFGGTETRALVFMDGSLYAGIGDWEDPELEDPLTPGAQVLRLDSPTSSWVEDQDFNQVLPGQITNKNYQAISILGTAHFDQDSSNNPITPVDVLMAGVWTLGYGLNIFEKTVTTGSVGAQGTCTKIWLVTSQNYPHNNAQVRSFASYTDSVTHVEMAFAGANPFGIFSGAFDSTANGISWGAAAEAGSANVTTGDDRVMSFAACGGKLYATIYDAIVVRTDGENPSWQIYYKYSGPPLSSESSGFRGLTCVPHLNGVGSMLIASLEGDSPDIYDIPLDGSQPTIELHTANYLATQLGSWVGYGIAAYNNMTVYPGSGTTSCPDYLIGLLTNTSEYAEAYESWYPTAQYLVRHCIGTYRLLNIVDPSITPAPSLLATRTLVVSQFSGDPAGTLYSGGYDAHWDPAHNTDWVYRGVPR